MCWGMGVIRGCRKADEVDADMYIICTFGAGVSTYEFVIAQFLPPLMLQRMQKTMKHVVMSNEFDRKLDVIYGCIETQKLFTIGGNTSQIGRILATWNKTSRGRTDRQTSPVGVLVMTVQRKTQTKPKLAL